MVELLTPENDPAEWQANRLPRGFDCNADVTADDTPGTKGRNTMPVAGATRHKSPSTLIRDKVLERWEIGPETSSPVERIYPPRMIQTIADVCPTSRPRVMRWMKQPDVYPLEWHELQNVAAEIGGRLRCMFSTEHA